MKFGAVVVHHESFWKNIAIISQAPRVLLTLAWFCAKIENLYTILKNHSKDFFNLFSDSERRKKRIWCGWPPFFMKTNGWGAMKRHICKNNLFSILTRYYELWRHQSKCWRLQFPLVIINNFQKGHVDIISHSKFMSNSVLSNFVWKLMRIWCRFQRQ